MSDLSVSDKEFLISVELGQGDRYNLMRRGAYFRPDAKGYTNDRREAGIWHGSEAAKHITPKDDEPVTMHAVQPLPYFSDRRDTQPMIERLNQHPERIPKFIRHLSDMIYEKKKVSEAAWCWNLVTVVPEHFAEAFGRTFGLWEYERR